MPENLDLQTTYRAVIDAARQRRFISYGDLVRANGANWNKARHELFRLLGDLVKLAAERNWPMPSSIVVNQNNLETGTLDGTALDGFINAAKTFGFNVQDPHSFVRMQQEKMFEWALNAPDEIDLSIDHGSRVLKIGGPKYVRFFGPVLDALRSLGGAAEPKAVKEEVRQLIEVSAQELNEKNKGGRSRYENRIAWARFYLSKAGLIDSRQHGRWVLTADGRETHLDHESAVSLYRDIETRFRDTKADEDDPAPDPTHDFDHDFFDDPRRSFWFVGALWDDGDQTERFLREGVWQNGHDKKFTELVQRMKAGDRIAIKASFTKKYGLPFDNQEKSVSCMRIKAIGTVIEGTQDGQTIKVEWTLLDEPKDWYFYTYRVTIVKADVSEEFARRLVQFTFGNYRQDYDFWLRQPYWVEKYSASQDFAVDPQREKEEAETDSEELTFEPYTVADIVADGCFLPERELTDALERLGAKKNLILQGPPGTGKTWLAKRLAYALIGTRDRKITRKRMRAIQFHPSLSYEDFVRGWRPDGNGQLKLIDGVFMEAIGASRAERDRPFVVIIEEINRGNPAQVFGEMLTLLESDKRREDEAIELAYHSAAGQGVFIPDNLFVIGTMNIADRSLV